MAFATSLTLLTYLQCSVSVRGEIPSIWYYTIPEISGNFAELCNDRLHIRAQFDNAGANNNTKII